MKDIKVVDARGQGCPQPVILAKKSIEVNDQVMVIVDDEVALENIRQMADKSGCAIQVEKKGATTYEIHLSTKEGNSATAKEKLNIKSENDSPNAGPFVLVFSENRMGRGNDELGDVLIKAFLHTLCQQENKPDVIIFYNTGVKLAEKDSEVIDDLKQLAEAGAELLICGTCANYFKISDRIGAGVISNMYDIAGIMCGAGRLVMP